MSISVRLDMASKEKYTVFDGEKPIGFLENKGTTLEGEIFKGSQLFKAKFYIDSELTEEKIIKRIKELFGFLEENK